MTLADYLIVASVGAIVGAVAGGLLTGAVTLARAATTTEVRALRVLNAALTKTNEALVDRVKCLEDTAADYLRRIEHLEQVIADQDNENRRLRKARGQTT